MTHFTDTNAQWWPVDGQATKMEGGTSQKDTIKPNVWMNAPVFIYFPDSKGIRHIVNKKQTEEKRMRTSLYEYIKITFDIDHVKIILIKI